MENKVENFNTEDSSDENDKSDLFLKEKFESTERAYEVLEDFYDSKQGERKEEISKKWQNEYKETPNAFFSKENFDHLKTLPSGERLSLLAKVSNSLSVSTDSVEEYYETFPDDLKAVEILFKNCEGFPEDGLDYSLFGVSTSAMDFSKPLDLSRYRTIKQYKEICERKRLAPDFILDGSKETFGSEFTDFGKMAEIFGKAFDEAEGLVTKGNHYIDPEQIFTSEYEALPPEEKSKFLRSCVNTLHGALLFHETYNSCFTEDFVKRDSQMQHYRNNYNEAHSMIFHTRQPLSSYDDAQDRYDFIMSNTHRGGGDLEEYSYHRLLLAVLNKMGECEAGQEENVDKMVDFWDKNRNPIFGNSVAEVISKQGVERGASGFLKLLREEKGDKRALTAMLYRLEFGKIGISEEGVKYLERIYDLQEFNNPDYHVSRLAPNGEMGIFDEDRKLIKYFNLNPEDLVSDEKIVKAAVMDFVYENLFFAREDETSEERAKREKYLEEFKEHYYEISEQELFGDDGNIRLNNLSLKEQGWFLIYYNESSEENRERLKDFMQNFGEDGIKTFLAMETEENMGETILDISESLKREDVRMIFYKFNDIIRGINFNKDDLKNIFKEDKDVSELEINRISQNLLKKGAGMLSDFDSLLKDEDFSEKESVNEFLELLNSYKEDLILTASVFKGMEKGSVELDDLEGVNIESFYCSDFFKDSKLKDIFADRFLSSEDELISTEAISEMKNFSFLEKDIKSLDTLSELVSIYSENYKERPVFAQKLLRKFLLSFLKEDSGDKIYILDKDEQPMAFCKFAVIGEKEEYVSALNVQEKIKDCAVGVSFSNRCLEKEFQSNDIIAHCDAFSSASSIHIEKGGFAVSKIIDDFDEEGESFSSFEIKKEMDKKYIATSMSRDEIGNLYDNKFTGNQYDTQDNLIILKYPSGDSDIYKKAKELVNDEEYVITRYFYSGEEKENVYCALEKGAN